MGTSDTATAAVVVAAATLALLGTLPLGALGASGGATAAANPHGGPGNYTVGPVDDPETAANSDGDETCLSSSEAPTGDEGSSGGENCDPYDGHMPGDENASYAQFSAGGEAATADLEVTHFIIHEDLSGDYDMRGCTTQDAAVAGIDRGNNDSGYETNEPLLSHAKGTTERENVIIVELFREGALAGEPLRLNTEDQIVARVEDCYTNPSEPGWYQWRGYANGTTPSGGMAEIELFSHYFYVCKCTTRQQAVEKLGPPPSQGPGGTPTPTPDGSTETPTPEPATPDDTTTPTAAGPATEASTPTGTPAPGTATATPRPATDSPTPERGTDRPARSTPTATPTPGGTTVRADEPGGTTATGTATGSGRVTPTAGAGPGLGVLGAVGGVLGAALLLRRE